MGRWLVAQDLVPDFIVSSPARRARQTARRAARVMGLERSRVEFDDRLYMEGVDAALQVIEDRPAPCQRMLIVGHNPTLEMLVTRLAGDALVHRSGKRFPTATIAHFREGRFVQLVRPRDLTVEAG